MTNSSWYIYILHCADNTLYTGITTDLDRRLVEHNSSTTKAAKYTRARQPVRIAYWESASDRSHASRREREIKRMPKSSKMALIHQHPHTLR